MVDVLIARVEYLQPVSVESQPYVPLASGAFPLSELFGLSNQNKLVLHFIT